MNTDRKILAVDNDENALYNLRQEIKDIYPSAKIVAFCEVTQVLTYLNEQEPASWIMRSWIPACAACRALSWPR